MKFNSDNRIVMTLDAGGTNFVFSAIRNEEEIIEPISYPSNAHDLDRCLATIIKGFTELRSNLPAEPVAISFAFPGPADYPNGIIGDLTNLPAFRGGIALGPMLEDKFKIPVFINNDGDLFVYGEAIAGFLPFVNQMLKTAGSPKRYKNLFGITLGTGFGAGIVINGELFIGDNSNGAEIWITRNKIINRCFAEEGVSIRAIQRVYNDHAKDKMNQFLSPKDIFEIATGKQKGVKDAGLKAFYAMAEVAGDALANAITLLDGLIVIGGGLSGAAPVFLPMIVAEMNSTIEFYDGRPIPRLVQKVFNLEDHDEMKGFLSGNKTEIMVPGSQLSITYSPMKRTGIGISKLGTSKAISIGAYAFALNMIDKLNK